jgi:hypothetical protein
VRVLKESGGDLINASMCRTTLPWSMLISLSQSWRRVNDLMFRVSFALRGTKSIPLRDTLQPLSSHQSNVDSPNI